jgi:hypothetical protein
MSHATNIEQSGKSRRGFLTVWKLPSPHVGGDRVQSLTRALYMWKRKRKRNNDNGKMVKEPLVIVFIYLRVEVGPSLEGRLSIFLGSKDHIF